MIFGYYHLLHINMIFLSRRWNHIVFLFYIDLNITWDLRGYQNPPLFLVVKYIANDARIFHDLRTKMARKIIFRVKKIFEINTRVQQSEHVRL